MSKPVGQGEWGDVEAHLAGLRPLRRTRRDSAAAEEHLRKLKLTAANVGGETHEFVIVRATDAPSLPTKPDGAVDEEQIPESAKTAPGPPA